MKESVFSKQVNRFGTDVSRRAFIKSSAALCAVAVAPYEALGEETSSAEELSAPDAPKFLSAEPVWAEGRETEMNVALRFAAEVRLEASAIKGATLRATGSSIMRVRVNGNFAGYGPARGPKGWYRVDEWKLEEFLKPGANRIEIEISGYNSVSYYLLSQPSFLQAELVDGNGRVLVATGTEETKGDRVLFTARDLTGVRIQKVQRMGWHRTFVEAYDLTDAESVPTVKLARRPDVPLLPRRAPYPDFAVVPVAAWLQRGRTEPKKDFKPWRGSYVTGINDKFTGYKVDELSFILANDLLRLETSLQKDAEPLSEGAVYREGDVQIVDFGADYAGFWAFDVETSEGATLAIGYDEILDKNGDVNFMRCSTCNAVKWTLPPRDEVFRLETFEPQAARYVKIYCLKGSFTLKKAFMREYAHPATKDAALTCSDPGIEEIYAAATLTFRSNAVDVFTDCPHRERAGWMCDSFFTARAAFDLTGRTDVEDAVFENYALPKSFPNLPEGATPMCYPSDTWHGQFIPNWMMWLVLELEEYYARSGNRARVDSLKNRVYKMFEFFKGYENSDGLLEKLPNRVFVEWSDANKFLQDVNYPTNMLYAAALCSAARLWNDESLREKAEQMRRVIREQAFDGEFFVDHAKREKDGTLTVLQDKSEVCQYFAFFFETATPESHPDLWKKLIDEFGPERANKKLYPEVCKANAFVGNTLRFELLSRTGRGEQILEESLAYYKYMADRTGTLWENATAGASCNHGFASHVARVLYRDVVGIAAVDAQKRRVLLRAPKIGSLDRASGRVPVPGGCVELSWEKNAEGIKVEYSAPDGYEIVFENASGLELVE